MSEQEKENVAEETVNEEQDVTENEDASTTEEQENEEKEVREDEQAEQSETELLKQEIEQLTNQLLRSKADYENLRRRSREEREAQAKYRSQPLIEALLPVIDNFERGLAVEAETEEGKSILQGMNIVYRQLQEALSNEGVEVIETADQMFDPHLHQAVMQVEEEGFESGQIVEELQKGYKLKDRVIRPSMVKVNA